MKKLNIEITKAQLTGFSVKLEKSKPIVTATIALLTEGGKQISEYSISTQSWYNEDQKFDLPTELINPIVDIMETLEGVVVRHCKDSQLALAAGR